MPTPEPTPPQNIITLPGPIVVITDINSSSNVDMLYTPPSSTLGLSDTTVRAYEHDIFKALVNNAPSDLTTLATGELLSEVKHHIGINSDLADSNVIMCSSYTAGTPATYANSSYQEFISSTKSRPVTIGAETSTPYTSNTRYDWTDGKSSYTSNTDSHILTFDTTDTNYNLSKAMNDKESNILSNRTNGIEIKFNNTYNKNNAFYNECTSITRSSTNALVLSSSTLQLEGISSKLNVELLSSTATTSNPEFGSLKLVQDALLIDIISNFNSFPSPSPTSLATPSPTSSATPSPTSSATPSPTSSMTPLTILNTLSLLNNTTQAITAPTTSLSESEFLSYFPLNTRSSIGVGYKFQISVGAETQGGYTLNSNDNMFNPISYDESNTIVTSTSELPLFEINDDDIKKNINYMKSVKDANSFQNSYIQFKNGDVVVDTTQSTHPNYNSFLVGDGIETIEILSELDLPDLSAEGSVDFISSNNILGSIHARTSKVSHVGNSINNLKVIYGSSEDEYIPTVGTLSTTFKEIRTITSAVSTAFPHTRNIYNGWNNENVIGISNDTIAAFQTDTNSEFYDKHNVILFEANNMDELYNPNEEIVVGRLRKLVNFGEIRDWQSIVNGVDNTPLNFIQTSTSMTNIDLSSISAAEVNVRIGCQVISDLPTLTTNFAWNSGNGNNGLLEVVNGTIINGNSEFILSYIELEDRTDLLDTYIYDVLSAPHTTPLIVNIKWECDRGPIRNRDTLSNRALVELSMEGVLSSPITKQIDSQDIKIIEISRQEPTLIETITNLTAYKFKGSYSSIPSYYQVRKYSQTITYTVSMRIKLAAYKNIWATSLPIVQVTTFFELYNNAKSKTMPDYHLLNIVYKPIVTSLNPGASSNPIVSSENQVFFTNRNINFLNNLTPSATNYSLGSTASFLPKDLLGFTACTQRKILIDGVDTWVDFDHSNSPYDFKLDFFYDNIYKEDFGINTSVLGTILVALDVTAGNKLGVSTHTTSYTAGRREMYRLAISALVGDNTFIIDVRKYNIKTELPLFNNWSIYDSESDIFPRKQSGELLGIQINDLETSIINIPVPGNEDIIEFSLINSNTGNTCFTLQSNKTLLESYNIACFKNSIIKHEYTYGRMAPFISGTEFLVADRLPESLILTTPPLSNVSDYTQITDYVKLKYNNNISGCYATIYNNSAKGDSSEFNFNSDTIKVSMLNTSRLTNAYTGTYSGLGGESIEPTSTGYPISASSSHLRPLIINNFRGYINNNEPLRIIRTPSKLKYVINNSSTETKFFDSLDNTNTCTTDFWKNKQLVVSNIKKGLFTSEDLNTMTSNSASTTTTTNIGDIGLKFNCNCSIFPRSFNSSGTIYPNVGINVSFANYNISISNPLDSTLNTTLAGLVSDVILKDFNTHSLVAARVKNYYTESYSLEYLLPRLKVFKTNTYVCDVKLVTNWVLSSEHSDSDLRAGVTVNGYVKLLRTSPSVSSSITYAMLPPPSASVTQYNYVDLGTNTLPFSYTGINKLEWSFDITGDNTTSYYPYNKNAPTVGSNLLNSVGNTVGTNNIMIKLNIVKALLLRESDYSSATFEIEPNILKIIHSVGIYPSTSNSLELFNSKVSNLTNPDFWFTDSYDNSKTGNATYLNQVYNLRWAAPKSSVAAFPPLATVSNDINIYVDNIGRFGTGSYFLNHIPLDSTRLAVYYVSKNLTTDNKLKLTLNRLSSSSVTTYQQALDLQAFTNAFVLRPLMTKLDSISLTLNTTNVLTDIPYNVEEITINAFNSVSSLPTSWINNTTYESLPSPIAFRPLSKIGSSHLQKMTYVNASIPLKVFTSARYPLLTIHSNDKGIIYQINQDGKAFSTGLVSNGLSLSPIFETLNGSAPSIIQDSFSNNCTPMLEES